MGAERARSARAGTSTSHCKFSTSSASSVVRRDESAVEWRPIFRTAHKRECVVHGGGNMANPYHLDIIRKSVQAWNGWRAENRELTPDVSGADFSYEDLSGVNFSGMDLSYENLSSATLVGANLDRTVLDHTDLSDAYLRDATFRRANLNCVNLYGAVLAGADFTDCDLSEGSLKEADLENAVFHNSDLRSTTFTGAAGLTARQVLEARTLRGVIDLDPLVRKQVASHRPRLLAPAKD